MLLLFCTHIIFAQEDQKEISKTDSLSNKEKEFETEEEITVTSTRTSYHIEDAPLRIEVLGAEEINEKMIMRPTNISMILSEATGIQTLQTSSLSGSMSIKMQGLDGKYTQILKDGFPLYGGLSSGLSVMQIPPLDLMQVEFIKGPSSTLYGGDAISGIVNLISKIPMEQRKLDVFINATDRQGYDFNLFYSSPFRERSKFGLTFLTSANYQKAYDADDDGFSDIPAVKKISLNPKLFWKPDAKTNISLGIFYNGEIREGGNVTAIENNTFDSTSFVERNISSRVNTQFTFQKEIGRNFLTIKNGVNYFKLDKEKSVKFSGKQFSSFTEISYEVANSKNKFLAGVNLISDNFSEDKIISGFERNYNHLTTGVFIQNDYSPNKKFTVQAGARGDYEKKYGFFFLPKLSAIYKAEDNLAFRGGIGLGYKLPALFTEDTESNPYAPQELLGFSDSLKAEKSIGGNFDVNYRTFIGNKIGMSINQAFYYTVIDNPLVLSSLPGNQYAYVNTDGNVTSKGFETSLKINYEHYRLYAGYTFIEAIAKVNNSKSSIELVPKHKLNLIGSYEDHGNFRTAIEFYYFGKQYLSDGMQATDYWVAGYMAEKYFSGFSIFVNFENFLNTKQSSYGKIVFPPMNRPSFAEIYAPLEGRVISLGVKINL